MKKQISLLIFCFSILIYTGCQSQEETQASLRDNNFEMSQGPNLPLDKLNLPDGFEISIYASVPNARSMAISSDGTLFVGNRNGDKVYAVKDTDGDNVADKKYIIGEGMRSPNGVAIKDGDLYVAEISKINVFRDIESNLDNPPAPEVIVDDYPTEGHHGWKYIAFGPDGKLYVPVGAPCNICENRSEPIYASITRINDDGSNREIVANGVRNTVGFTWHPETGEMWFTDNGRDMMGDDLPPCELNRLEEVGQHFGYPYCHGGTIPDPEFGDRGECSEFVKPVQALGPHVAPLGLKFVTQSNWPSEFQGSLIIAEHGSWNRTSKIGYRLSLVKLNGNFSAGYGIFIDGWLDEEKQEAWGRPVDVLMLEDGSMLISDDFAGVIYRVVYKG